jgi:ankyrin repeat protein
VQVVRLLIAAGADVNAKNNDGAAPLVIALRNGQVTMAKTLIAAGAENVVMKVHFPKIRAEWEVGRGGTLLLHAAVRIGRRASIAERSDINEPNQPNWPREWMEFLLANGADPNERDRKGDTPLHAAILERNEEAVRLLIAHGADVKARNLAGSTILHYGASEGLTGVISLLLEKGADVNAQDNDDDTPLHSAALRGHKDAVELLLAHGADPKIQNSRNRTPLDEAARRGHTEVAGLLRGKP